MMEEIRQGLYRSERVARSDIHDVLTEFFELIYTRTCFAQHYLI